MPMLEAFLVLAAVFVGGPLLIKAARSFTRKVEDEGLPIDQALQEVLDEVES